jgi:DNA-binding MarR family transcriptional regulator
MAPSRRPGTTAGRPAVGDYVLGDQIGHLLRRAYQRHVAIFQEVFGDEGPTSTQFAALVRLAEHGELSQNRLGRLTAMDPATIKGVVERLEERGLLTRRPDPDDRRRLLLSLTPAAREVMPGLVEKARRVTAETRAPLSPEEADTLSELLRRIV